MRMAAYLNLINKSKVRAVIQKRKYLSIDICPPEYVPLFSFIVVLSVNYSRSLPRTMSEMTVTTNVTDID